MESGISGFDAWSRELGRGGAGRDLRAALERAAARAARDFGARMWFAEILGRRWSYIAGSMERAPAAVALERRALSERIGVVVEDWGRLAGEQRARALERLAGLCAACAERG
ncbi:MAG: hypothetical protein JXR96_05995 [Deltaproteobacteria bacterium]|nr:hypothetical protein [Deltaproteobacteria bacterium]